MAPCTIGVAAMRLGRRFIGIEIDPKWFDLAGRQIDAAASQGVLVDGPLAPIRSSRGENSILTGKNYCAGNSWPTPHSAIIPS